jgi:hypothetical protein
MEQPSLSGGEPLASDLPVSSIPLDGIVSKMIVISCVLHFIILPHQIKMCFEGVLRNLGENAK